MLYTNGPRCNIVTYSTALGGEDAKNKGQISLFCHDDT